MAAGPAALAALMADSAGLDDRWRNVIASTPRHLFIPDRVWTTADGGRPRPVHRAESPDAWWGLVYSDQPVTTQLDDGAPDGPGLPTSSTSLPSLVADMLALLELDANQRVLEIGTGTGWNAGLLAARAGDEWVTSVEIDPVVADAARAALKAAGRAPLVVTGDGAAGYPNRAPFDRVVATVGAVRVPFAWVAQSRPGGRLVVPVELPAGGLLAVLDVDEHQAAHGRFAGDAAFMLLRDQRPEAYRTGGAAAIERETALDAAELDDRACARAVGLALPGTRITAHTDSGGYYRITVTDDRGSWAQAVSDDDGEHVAWTDGPRDLWAGVEHAHTAWVDAGRPEPGQFGLTVDAAGQRVWLGGPEHPWPRR